MKKIMLLPETLKKDYLTKNSFLAFVAEHKNYFNFNTKKRISILNLEELFVKALENFSAPLSEFLNKFCQYMVFSYALRYRRYLFNVRIDKIKNYKYFMDIFYENIVLPKKRKSVASLEVYDKKIFFDSFKDFFSFVDLISQVLAQSFYETEATQTSRRFWHLPLCENLSDDDFLLTKDSIAPNFTSIFFKQFSSEEKNRQKFPIKLEKVGSDFTKFLKITEVDFEDLSLTELGLFLDNLEQYQKSNPELNLTRYLKKFTKSCDKIFHGNPKYHPRVAYMRHRVYDSLDPKDPKGNGPQESFGKEQK